MRLYWEIARRSFRRAMTYRGAYIGGLLTNAFFGMLITFVYRALYAARGTVAGFSLEDAVSYTWVTQSLISLGGGWFTWEIMSTIKSGEVVTDLTRPWNFYGYWLSRTLGERAFNLLLRGSLTYMFGIVFFGARVPSPAEALAFSAAISLSMLVSFSLTFMVNASGFWLLDATGLIIISNIVLMFFSGFLLPLAFFPPRLAAIAAVLPFRAVTSLPAQVFLGKIRGLELGWTLLLQSFWAVILAALALLVMRAAMRKVTIQGG